MYLQVLPSLYSYFKFCFRHVRKYSDIIQEHTHAYSEPFPSLAYSKPWKIFITKHIQTLRYIYNTKLNIFKKLNLGRLTVLNALFFYTCYLSSRANSLSLTLYCRYIQAYSSLIQPYLVLLRHIKSSGIFRDILLETYSGIF